MFLEAVCVCVWGATAATDPRRSRQSRNGHSIPAAKLQSPSARTGGGRRRRQSLRGSVAAVAGRGSRPWGGACDRRGEAAAFLRPLGPHLERQAKRSRGRRWPPAWELRHRGREAAAGLVRPSGGEGESTAAESPPAPRTRRGRGGEAAPAAARGEAKESAANVPSRAKRGLPAAEAAPLPSGRRPVRVWRPTKRERGSAATAGTPAELAAR